MLTPDERDAFRTAAIAALATREFVEYIALRGVAKEQIKPTDIQRIQISMQPTATALLSTYKRTGIAPIIRFSGFLFTLTVIGDTAELHIARESDVVTVE